MIEPPRIKLDTSIHIPPLTDEVKEAQRAYKAVWDAWKTRTAENIDRLQTDVLNAKRRLSQAQDRAVGPWRIFE